ncbi:MAG: hypothetical protein KAG45_10880, partial [Methyloprofundus sp.]|nr:hypothetical protein [Methyloprofundus sp.]
MSKKRKPCWLDICVTLRFKADTKKGYSVSRNIVRYLLKKHKYVKRKAQKNITMGEHPDRNSQFENISQLKKTYLDAGNPVISMDTKKKE